MNVVSLLHLALNVNLSLKTDRVIFSVRNDEVSLFFIVFTIHFYLSLLLDCRPLVSFVGHFSLLHFPSTQAIRHMTLPTISIILLHDCQQSD